MSRDSVHQDQFPQSVYDLLDQHIEQHGWWAVRACWASDDGMAVGPWRVSMKAPAKLATLRDYEFVQHPIILDDVNFPNPTLVSLLDVRRGGEAINVLEAAGVEHLLVVDVANGESTEMRLMFAPSPGIGVAGSALDSVRTITALLPTLILHEADREALRLSAHRDTLTGLLNRTGLAEFARRLEPGPDLRAVMYVDLDRFKEVNDAHGHATGDEVLVDAARRLTQQLRPTDFVARVGGDEFVIVATSVLDEEAVVSLAQRLVAALSQETMLANGLVASVAASAGVVMWSADVSFDQAVVSADSLMYEAKRLGGGIAMKDATGRILVRDPFDGGAEPEEIEHGRPPLRAQLVSTLADDDEWGVHVLLRGDLSSTPLEQMHELIESAVTPLAQSGRACRLILEPQGRGWLRESLLLDLVAHLVARFYDLTILMMSDAKVSSIELRLVIEEVRARLGLGIVLGGIGSSSGGDLHVVAQVSPTVLVLDRGAVMNLEHTQPPGIVVVLASAIATALGVPLLILDPPAALDFESLAAWGATLTTASKDAGWHSDD